jgi:rhodanese-related sulfurtransferase
VQLHEARALWDESSTLFIDVRSEADYAVGHIQGALHLPEEEVEKRLPSLRSRLQRAGAIIVYCKSPDCGKSLWVALRLRNAGLLQTRIYPGGWNEWINSEQPSAGLGR